MVAKPLTRKRRGDCSFINGSPESNEAIGMPLAVLIATIIFSAAQAGEPPINVVGHAWAPFISPMGEPFRARTTSDNTLALWFGQADRNRDALLTAEEMQADADRFFATLDSDHDGEIGPEEMMAYEYEVAPEIQVNSKWRRSREQAAAETASVATRRTTRDRLRGRGLGEGYDPNEPVQGAARYALLNIPQPVAAADTDFNRAITLNEFRRAAAYRFQLLDTRHIGRLSLAELQLLVPKAPAGGRKLKRRPNEPDRRIGNPLPKED